MRATASAGYLPVPESPAPDDVGGPLPALTPVFAFRPRARVWLCWSGQSGLCGLCALPAFTFVLTFRPRTAVWLWLEPILPAFTFVLIFIDGFPFLEKLRLIAATHAAYLYK